MISFSVCLCSKLHTFCQWLITLLARISGAMYILQSKIPVQGWHFVCLFVMLITFCSILFYISQEIIHYIRVCTSFGAPFSSLISRLFEVKDIFASTSNKYLYIHLLIIVLLPKSQRTGMHCLLNTNSILWNS